MPNIITAKIDLKKLDMSRIFRGKNGAEYIDLVLMPVRESRYGETHMVKQSASKEEREAGVQLAIVGNATERAAQTGQGSTQPAATRQAPAQARPAPQRPADDMGDVDTSPF
jgi:hypothetical protein